MWQHKQDMADDNVVVEGPGQTVVRSLANALGGESKITVEDNDDWRHVSITPPPKNPVMEKSLVAIAALPKFAQGAFSSTKRLN